MEFKGRKLTGFLLTPNAIAFEDRRQTVGDKLHSQKGKNPDRQLRSLKCTKWERMWSCRDIQEVGLEAAIL